MYVSCTVGRKGGNVYEGWLDRVYMIVYALLCLVAFKAAIGLEIGPRGGHAHLQVVFAVLCCIPDACKKLQKAIKDFIPVQTGSKGHCQCYANANPLLAQTFISTIGYVSKLPLAMRLFNITGAWRVEGGSQTVSVGEDKPTTGHCCTHRSQLPSMACMMAIFFQRRQPGRYHNAGLVAMNNPSCPDVTFED